MQWRHGDELFGSPPKFDGCLVKIETDAGLVGYGETGTNGPMARAHIQHMTVGSFPGSSKLVNGPAGLIGADPLAIQRHFYRMTSLQHPFMAPIGTLSGIDIALWDLAGKITIAEVEEIVEVGELEPTQIHTPGIYVNRIIQGDFEKRIERLTLAKQD